MTMKTGVFLLLAIASCFTNTMPLLANHNLFSSPYASIDGKEESAPTKSDEARFVFPKVFFEDRLSQMAPVSGYFEEILEKKFYLLNDVYTDEVPMSPGSLSTRTVVRKPVIYSSINKIYRHLKSECKSGQMSIQEAQQEWSHILEVGLTMLYSETEEFENVLRQSKSMADKILLFNSVKLSD
jgi:hypothetical protein